MSKIRPIFLIAGNTVTGVLRGVVLNVLLVLAALLIIASMATTALQPGEMRRMLVDSGLAVITVLGAMISILTGFTMVPNEVQNRTIYPVMARPVGRWQFILGKYVGACGINGITVALLSLIFFIVYFFKMHEFDGRLLAAVGMIFATLMVLSAIIIFLSTFMSWIGTIIVSTVIWFMASYSQFMWDLAYYHSDGSPLSVFFKAVQKLLPDFQAMDLRYDIVQLGVPNFELGRIMLPLGNAGIFLVISLALAVLVFNYREL